MTFAVGTLAFLAACGDDSSSGPVTGPGAMDTTIEALAECTAPAFLKEGDKVVLCSREFTQVFDAVVKAVENGEIKETRIDESVKRILDLKK